MPITFAERMAMTEEKNKAQRLELANAFLPIFQGIAQKKMLDEQYALEQKRENDRRIAEQKRTADALNKVAAGAASDETMPTSVQSIAFANQQNLKDIEDETNAYFSNLPKDVQDKYISASAKLTPKAQNMLIKNLTAEYKQNIKDAKDLVDYENRLKLALKYSPRQISTSGGDSERTAYVKNTEYRNTQIQNEIRNGKAYTTNITASVNGSNTVKDKQIRLLVKASNYPKMGGFVLGTTYKGKTYWFNGVSAFEKKGNNWVKSTPPQPVQDVFFQAQSEWNGTKPAMDESVETNPLTSDKQLDSLFGGL